MKVAKSMKKGSPVEVWLFIDEHGNGEAFETEPEATEAMDLAWKKWGVVVKVTGTLPTDDACVACGDVGKAFWGEGICTNCSIAQDLNAGRGRF